MSPDDSVSRWVQQLRAGDQDAVQPLWERYFTLLVALARKKLQGVPRRAADEEDVALSAFDSFCRGAEQNRFPRLYDRDDLWQLLVLITVRKAADLAGHEGRGKRDWRRAVDEDGAMMAQVVSREPDPAFAAEVAEECRHLLRQLDDDQLRAIALHKLEGYANTEIAERLGCSLATVERRLRLIRKSLEETEC